MSRRRRQFLIVEIRIDSQWVRVCSICKEPLNGCGGNGMCGTHYTRWRRHGDPSIVKPRGMGLRGLSPERQRMIRAEAGRKGARAKAHNQQARFILRVLEEVRADTSILEHSDG